MKSVTLMTMKGGDGKSTCAINIAAWFADKGKQVHLSDSDVNRHLWIIETLAMKRVIIPEKLATIRIESQ